MKPGLRVSEADVFGLICMAQRVPSLPLTWHLTGNPSEGTDSSRWLVHEVNEPNVRPMFISLSRKRGCVPKRIGNPCTKGHEHGEWSPLRPYLKEARGSQSWEEGGLYLVNHSRPCHSPVGEVVIIPPLSGIPQYGCVCFSGFPFFLLTPKVNHQHNYTTSIFPPAAMEPKGRPFFQVCFF